MATVGLYYEKINQMPFLFGEAQRSVTHYQSELTGLKARMAFWGR